MNEWDNSSRLEGVRLVVFDHYSYTCVIVFSNGYEGTFRDFTQEHCSLELKEKEQVVEKNNDSENMHLPPSGRKMG